MSAIDLQPKVSVYRADARLAEPPLVALRRIVEEVWRYRWHVGITFARDFRAVYHGTALGVFWAVILPLMPIGVYWLLGAVRVFPRHAEISPILYTSIGITIWFLLVGAILRPIAVVEAKNAEIARVHYPLIGVVASGFAELCFDTAVRCLLVVPAYAVLVGVPPPMALLAIPALLACVLGCLGIGLILAIVNAVYRDVGKVANVIMRYLIFLSAAVFPLPDYGVLHMIGLANPLHVMIDSLRQLMIFGSMDNPWPLSGVIIVSAIVFVAGCTVFYRLEYRIRGIV
jgi:lipopolysaccharide transport system permease protein